MTFSQKFSVLSNKLEQRCTFFLKVAGSNLTLEGACVHLFPVLSVTVRKLRLI